MKMNRFSMPFMKRAILIVFLSQFLGANRSIQGKRTKTNYCQIVHNPKMEGLSAKCVSIDIRTKLDPLPRELLNLRIVESAIPAIPAGIFGNFGRLRILALNKNRIRVISRESFAGLTDLVKLDLSYNSIHNFKDDVFEYTPKLSVLDLSRNFVRTLRYVTLAIARLKSLQELRLSNNKLLETIAPSDIDPLPKNCSIKRLVMTNCLLRVVHRHTFAKFQSNLQELYLDQNYLLLGDALTNLTDGLRNSSSLRIFSASSCRLQNTLPLQNLENVPLKELNLNFNYFKSFETYNTFLPRLPNLEYLNVSSSNMDQLHKGTFVCCGNLKHLALDGNSFLHIPSFVEDLVKLETLSINSQIISNQVKFIIERGVFRRLANLKYLDLTGNSIVEIKTNTFEGLVNISALYLQNCAISKIAGDSFVRMRRLKLLDLSKNSFFLDGNIFAGLESLAALSLRYATVSVKHGQDKLFIHSPNIKYLNLVGNDLTNYDLDNLLPLRKLIGLDLSHNRINEWKVRLDIFKDHNISYLGIHSNEITELTGVMIEDFTSIRFVGLSPNPFDCSLCSTRRFQNWLRKIYENKSDTLLVFTQGIDVNCSKPRELSGKRIDDLSVDWTYCENKEIDNSALLLSVAIASVALGFASACCVYCIRWYLRYWFFRLRVRVGRYKAVSEQRNYKYDAFVSYSQDDFWWVKEQLIPNIENDSTELKLCIHERDFIIGSPICDNIFNAIDISRKTILVISDDYLKSRWCMFELHMAQHRLFDDSRDSLIVVELKKPNPKLMNGNISYICKTRTYLQWEGSSIADRYFWARLKHAIAKPLTRLELPTIT
ncbi:tlr21 (predicted) [Pycnogonum litorale]